MKDHLLHDHLSRILQSHRHHAQTITHQDNIDPGRISRMRAGKVMRREHGNGLALLIQAA